MPDSPASTAAAFNARSKFEKSLPPSSEGGGSSVQRADLWQSGLRHGMAAREYACPTPRLRPPLLSMRDRNLKRASLPHPRTEAPLFSALIHGSQACVTAWRRCNSGNFEARLKAIASVTRSTSRGSSRAENRARRGCWSPWRNAPPWAAGGIPPTGNRARAADGESSRPAARRARPI